MQGNDLQVEVTFKGRPPEKSQAIQPQLALHPSGAHLSISFLHPIDISLRIATN